MESIVATYPDHSMGQYEINQFNFLGPQVKISGSDSICPNCGKAYTYRKNMLRHLKVECDKKPSQKCPYCWFITKHKSVVKTHINRKHKDLPNIL